MTSTAKTGGVPDTPKPSSTTREGSWRGSSDALLDAFETLLQEGDLSYTVKRQSGGKWSSEELLSSCQTLLDDARDVVLSVESPGDSSSKKIKSWLNQTPPQQEPAKDRAAQINYILGPSRTVPGHQQRKSQAFEHNIDMLFGEVEVECDSGRGTKSITNTTGSSSAITRPRSLGELSDTDSYSSFESYDRFDPGEVLVSDSEDDCFLEFETCSSGSEEESEMMTDDRFSLIDTGNEGDIEETSTDAGSNYSVFTTSAEDLWLYNPSYGDTSDPSTMSPMSPGLLTPPSVELSQGSSDETLRALSALGSNSSIENTSCQDNISQSENNVKDVLVTRNVPREVAAAVTSPAALKQVEVPRGIQGVPKRPTGLPSPRTDDEGSAALSRAKPTSTYSVRAPSSTQGPCSTATVGDARMPQQVVPQGAAAGDKDARARGDTISSAGGVVRPQPLRTVSATVPVEPPRREEQHQQAIVAPPPPLGFAGGTAPSSEAVPGAASVPRHWSNTIANLPHADSEVDFLDHSEDMADIFGGETSTLKRKQQHRDTVLFNEEFKNLVGAKDSHVIAPLNELFGQFRYSDGYEDDSLAYANILVVNRAPVEEMETTTVTPSSAPREEASARILRGRRPAPQPPATPTPPQTPPPNFPNKPAPLFKTTSSAPGPCKSPVGTPTLVQRVSSRASTPGRNSPYSWVRLGPKRPAPLPPVFLPGKKAPAPPPPKGDSSTLKRKQNKSHHMKPVDTSFRMGSDIPMPPGGTPGVAVPSGARLNNTAPTSKAPSHPPTPVKEEGNLQRTKATGTSQNQDFSDIYSDLYGFKYQAADIENKTEKKSKGNHSNKNKIYSKLCSSGDNFEGPIFGGDGSVVTKLGDEDFLVKTVNGEEFLVTSIGGDEYLVSNVNMDKDESKKSAEDVSIFKNTDGVFSLKEKDVLKSSSKKKVNKHGSKSRKSESTGSKSNESQSSDSISNKDCQENSSSRRGHGVEGMRQGSGDAPRGSFTEGSHSRSAMAATAPSATAPATSVDHALTTTTMPIQNQKVYNKQQVEYINKQVPPGNIRAVDNKTLYNENNQEVSNLSNTNDIIKVESLNTKSDYVTTIYVQDIEVPAGSDKGPVRNYGTVRATTVNTSNQGTPKVRTKTLNTNEARHSKSCGEVVVPIDALSNKGSVAEVSNRVTASGGSIGTVTAVAAAVGQGGGVPSPSPCDSSECQVPSAASGALAAEARRGRPSGEHDAVRAARDAPSHQRPHAAPHSAIGYATLLLGEDLWTYPVYGTVEQCQTEQSKPTQEWALVVQGQGWGIVPSGDSDLVLKYSDTMDGMHARQSNHIIGANVNGLDNMTKTNQIDKSAVHAGANNINGISERHSNESDANLPVHGFELVQNDFGVVNNLLPVFDPVLCSPVRDDMSGAVTYRVKHGDTWHQDSHRAKRNSDICDMTMYRDPPLLPDAGGGGGGGGGSLTSGEMTPATSSRSIRLCGVALGAPLITGGANPFRRHTLPRKVRLSSLPPGPEDSSTTPPPPPVGISAPSSPKVGKPPVPFFPRQQQQPQYPQYPQESLFIDSATTTPTNISPVSTPSQDSGCTTPTESCAYATPPGSSPATTPTSESNAYVTAAEVIIHDANENMVNRTYPKDCDLVKNNKQNVLNRLNEIDSKVLEINNSKRTESIETSPHSRVYTEKDNYSEFSPNAPGSEPISPEPPPPEAVTTQCLVDSENFSNVSTETITHAVPTHYTQPVLESTINTLESEKSLAVKCIHESSSNLCPLVSISNVATHKEVAILPAPSITVHSYDATENGGAVSNVDSQITEKDHTPPSSSLKTISSDCGKSTDSMRSPTPSDLERRPSFNKIPTPFGSGKSVTLPRNLRSSTNLVPQGSDSLDHNKARSTSSLLSSETTLAKQDSEKSLIKQFAAGIISNKSIGIKNNQCSKDNDSVKAKSASSLLDNESNVSQKVRDKSPIAVFAAGTLQNDECGNKINIPIHNQSSCSNDTKDIENISNISNSTAVNSKHISNINNDKLSKRFSEIIQNMDSISSAGIHSDGAVSLASEVSNSNVASPVVLVKGNISSSSSSGAAPIPSPLQPSLARCKQDNNPDNSGNTRLQEEAVVVCNSDLKTHTTAAKQKPVYTTQIHRDSRECHETPAVDIISAAADTSKTPCGDVSGGGDTIQNMASAGGSIIIPLAARDQADDKDETVIATAITGELLPVQKQNNILEQHVTTSHLKDASGDRSSGRTGTSTTEGPSAHDTAVCSHMADTGSQPTAKDQQYVNLVIGETGEVESQQTIISHDAVKQNDVQHISVGATNDKTATNTKTDLLTDCDILELGYSQNECQIDSFIATLDTGTINLETDTKNQDEKVIDLISSKSNEINNDKIQTSYITLQNENDDKTNIPQEELFIIEDKLNIPVKCIVHEDINKSEDCNETEKSLNDSLSEGLRAITKSSSFSSKPRGATISNCAALIALTGSTPPRPPSHFPMDIICQSKKQVNTRQRLATTLGEPVEPAVVQRRRQSSLGHVDLNQLTEKESHSERSRSASRIGYRHSVAIGETSNVPPFDLKLNQKSESQTKSNKDIRKLSPGPPQHTKPPFVRGNSFDSSDAQKKTSEIPKNTSKDNEKGNKTETLPSKSRMKQSDTRTMSPLPPIRAKKKVNKESDENKQNLHDEKKTTEVFQKENINEVQLPLIHRLASQNLEDLNREKEMESMSQDLEDLQREKALESIVTQCETQIPLSQPMEDRVEVSTHIFTEGGGENIGNANVKIEVCERPACIPSIEVLDGADSIECSKKISLDLEDIYKHNVKIDHLPTIAIPIIIETKAEDSLQQNIESGPSSLDQSQDEVYEAALEIAEPTPAFSNSSTSITTVISVESSTPTSVTPIPAQELEINQKISADEENEEQYEDARDELKENEISNDTYDANSPVKSQNSIVDQSLRKSSSPCAEIIHHESSPKALDERILISEEGSVSSGGVVTDPEMLASASASLSPASSWASNGGGPVARREYPLDEDEEELRWKALLAANEIENESGNDGCVSGEDFDAMDEEMRRLEEKLKIFENELGDSAEPSCPSDAGKTSSSTSSRPLFKPEDIEGLRISPLPKIYPPPSMNRTKHFSLMSKMDIEQYGESETESDNSDNGSDDSTDFLYVKKKLKLKPSDRKWRSHYFIRPKDMNVLNSNKTSIDVKKIENKEDEELCLSGIVSQNDHNDTFDEGFTFVNDKVDIAPPQEFSESYEIPDDNHLKLDNIQEEHGETDSIENQYEGIGDVREESIMFYGNDEDPLFGCMWNDDDGMTAIDFDIPEELQNYSGQGALFFIFEDDLDEPECIDPADYYIAEESPQICEPKYIENVKEKEKSPKSKDSERTFVSAFKNSLRKASKYLGPKIDSNQKKRSRSASASRNKHEHNTEDITTRNMHLLPAPENVPERRRSAALDDYKDYSGVYNVRSGIARPNYGPTSDSEGPEISCSSGEYYASPALCVNTSDEDPSLVIPPPPNIPPPPLPPVPPPRWSRWEPTESPQSAGAEYGCWFENTQRNSEENEVPDHSTEGNPNLDHDEMQFYLVGIPQNVQGNVYEDVQVTIEPEIIDSEQISVEQINTGAVYGEPYVKMTGWDPENCCDYEYIDTLACVDPVECIQQPLDCRGDEMSYSVAQPFAQSHRPTSVKQLKRKQQEKAQRQEVEEGQINNESNTCDGVPVKRGRPAQDESSHGRQVSPHPKAIGDRRSWPPRK